MILHRKQLVFIVIIILCLGVILLPLIAEKNFFSRYIQQVVAKFPLQPRPPMIKLTIPMAEIEIPDKPVIATVDSWCITIYPNSQQKQNMANVIQQLQQHGFAAFIQQDKNKNQQILIGPELDHDTAQSVSKAVTKMLGLKTDIIKYDTLKLD